MDSWGFPPLLLFGALGRRSENIPYPPENIGLSGGNKRLDIMFAIFILLLVGLQISSIAVSRFAISLASFSLTADAVVGSIAVGLTST